MIQRELLVWNINNAYDPAKITEIKIVIHSTSFFRVASQRDLHRLVLSLYCVGMTSVGIQLDPANSDSVISKSPLFRTQTHFPWICPCFFSHLLSAISNSVISNSPLFRTDFCFPWPKINPFILNYLVRVEKWTSSWRQTTLEDSWKTTNWAFHCTFIL